jgi:hypothetical protein
MNAASGAQVLHIRRVESVCTANQGIIQGDWFLTNGRVCNLSQLFLDNSNRVADIGGGGHVGIGNIYIVKDSHWSSLPTRESTCAITTIGTHTCSEHARRSLRDFVKLLESVSQRHFAKEQPGIAMFGIVPPFWFVDTDGDAVVELNQVPNNNDAKQRQSKIARCSDPKNGKDGYR